MITSISRPGHNILHMDYYIEGNWIYWLDYQEDQNNGIFRVRPDGSDKQHIIKVWGQGLFLEWMMTTFLLQVVLRMKFFRYKVYFSPACVTFYFIAPSQYLPSSSSTSRSKIRCFTPFFEVANVFVAPWTFLKVYPIIYVFNRPCVDGAVLQTPPSLINSLSSNLCPSQTVTASHLKFWHHSLCVKIYMSCVMCHMSFVKKKFKKKWWWS